MPTSEVRCVLVTIHGIGNQREDWSSDFDELLARKLRGLSASRRRRFVGESIWWADLSRLAELEAVAATTPLETGGLTYDIAYQQYAVYLAANVATTSGSTDMLESPFSDFAGRVLARLKDTVVTVADNTNDVANYVSNNGARLAIQRRLGDRLLRLRADHPKATIIVGAHSQGTIIAFDVLRLLGPWVGPLALVTMGSPLGWYLNFARWGRQQLGIAPEMTWLNLFDPQDAVGKALVGVIPWDHPRPEDMDIDNAGQGLDPHDHWHNPNVVDRYFQLIVGLLT